MSVPSLEDALLKVHEVARLLRKGRTTTYALIMTGQIPSIKIGGSRLVRKSDLDAYLAGLKPDIDVAAAS